MSNELWNLHIERQPEVSDSDFDTVTEWAADHIKHIELQLTAANARIREMEAERDNFHMQYRMECDKDTKRLEEKLTAERTISDKLEKALAHYATDETAEGWTAITALAELETLRKGEQE